MISQTTGTKSLASEWRGRSLPLLEIVNAKGKKESVDPESLLVGDRIVLKPGVSLPCDAIVMEAKDLVFQSLLRTGSVEAHAGTAAKSAIADGEEYTMSGSVLVVGDVIKDGSGIAVVVRLGRETLYGVLLAWAASRKQQQRTIVSRNSTRAGRIAKAANVVVRFSEVLDELPKVSVVQAELDRVFVTSRLHLRAVFLRGLMSDLSRGDAVPAGTELTRMCVAALATMDPATVRNGFLPTLAHLHDCPEDLPLLELAKTQLPWFRDFPLRVHVTDCTSDTGLTTAYVSESGSGDQQGLQQQGQQPRLIVRGDLGLILGMCGGGHAELIAQAREAGLHHAVAFAEIAEDRQGASGLAAAESFIRVCPGAPVPGARFLGAFFLWYKPLADVKVMKDSARKGVKWVVATSKSRSEAVLALADMGVISREAQAALCPGALLAPPPRPQRRSNDDDEEDEDDDDDDLAADNDLAADDDGDGDDRDGRSDRDGDHRDNYRDRGHDSSRSASPDPTHALRSSRSTAVDNKAGSSPSAGKRRTPSRNSPAASPTLHPSSPSRPTRKTSSRGASIGIIRTESGRSTVSEGGLLPAEDAIRSPNLHAAAATYRDVHGESLEPAVFQSVRISGAEDEDFEEQVDLVIIPNANPLQKLTVS